MGNWRDYAYESMNSFRDPLHRKAETAVLRELVAKCDALEARIVSLLAELERVQRELARKYE